MTYWALEIFCDTNNREKCKIVKEELLNMHINSLEFEILKAEMDLKFGQRPGFKNGQSRT